ncbi:MAG: winged helix-turn-helix transcriptional regulator [Candidatus Woesearchaeota archaeon]|jgi:DNA-binding Lrp family transcriptional regulator
MMTFIIDVKDRNILKELNINSRQSYNAIAKKTRLSKNQIVYRINKMVSDGIITKFCAVINHPKLGYHYYRYFFRLQFSDDDLIEKFVTFVKNLDNIYWVGLVEGKYNIIVESVHNHVSHAINNYLSISQKFSDYISEKELGLVAYGYTLHNNYVYNDFVSDVNVIRELHDGEKRYILDDKEKIIINALKEDSRVNVVELAKKTDLSTKTVMSKIKDFEKEKVIVKYRISLNHNIFGFEQHHVLLKLDYKNKIGVDEHLCEFLKMQKPIIRIVKPVGGFDIEFRCLVLNNYELLSLIKQIKDKFNGLIRSYESTLIVKTFPINTVKY